MEIAKNVRDFLVGMKDTTSPEQDALLSELQTLHEQYLAVMDAFWEDVSNLALTTSPEARIVAHQLRLKIYQDWRAKLMERSFADADKDMEPLRDHPSGCRCWVCELTSRLELYRKVIADYLKASTRIRKRQEDSDEPHVSVKASAQPDEELAEEEEYEIPSFLGTSPLLEMLNS